VEILAECELRLIPAMVFANTSPASKSMLQSPFWVDNGTKRGRQLSALNRHYSALYLTSSWEGMIAGHILAAYDALSLRAELSGKCFSPAVLTGSQRPRSSVGDRGCQRLHRQRRSASYAWGAPVLHCVPDGNCGQLPTSTAT
jgi:hypothetical protein